MPKHNTINTQQHYVSRMLLRGFGRAERSDHVHVFDKKISKSYVSAIKYVAAERGYYDLGATFTLDGAMNRADATASRVINRIRECRSLAGISRNDRGMLAGFVILQLLRTRGFQARYQHMGQTLIDAVKSRGLQTPAEWDAELVPEQQRKEYLMLIPGFMRDLLPHLLDKDLLLLKTDKSTPFCISDNPVVLNNTVNEGDGMRGTVGLAVQGIEIYLPISSELTLAYICPSVGMACVLEKINLQGMGGFINEKGFYYLQARDLGKALALQPDNVRHQNSLQIVNAERLVFSSRDDFNDAIDMIGRDPDIRFGPRLTVS